MDRILREETAALAIALDTKILLAIERLHTAKLYGEDMLSSKEVAVRDAKSLLDDFEIILNREDRRHIDPPF